MSTRPRSPLGPHAKALLATIAVAFQATACAAGQIEASAPPPTPPSKTAPQRSAKLDALAASSVTIEVLREGLWGERTATEEGHGSGFVIHTDEGPLVVTAAHVVYGATEIVAVDAQGNRAPVDELLSLDESADVAVLRAEGLSSAVRPIDVGPAPAVGDPIVLVSSPLGLQTTVAFGTVSATRPEAKAVQLAAGVSPGSSGGLVADTEGRAVAVIRSKAAAESGGENIALATPVSFALESLKHGRAPRIAVRPDRSKMADVAKHRLLTTRAQVFESYPAAASVTFSPGDRPLEHLCARTDAVDVALAIREVGREDPMGWRQGSGRACATVFGGQRVVVWVGTQKVGRKVELTISHQP